MLFRRLKLKPHTDKVASKIEYRTVWKNDVNVISNLNCNTVVSGLCTW